MENYDIQPVGSGSTENNLTVTDAAAKKPFLSKKQVLFVETYLTNGLDSASAYRSVYLDVSKPKSKLLGTELLNKPHIQQELIRQSNDIAKRERILKGEIVSALKELLDLSKQTDDRKTQLRCIDMMARMANLYPQTSPTVSLQQNMNVSAEEIEISFGGWNPDAKEEVEEADFTDVTGEDTEESE